MKIKVYLVLLLILIFTIGILIWRWHFRKISKVQKLLPPVKQLLEQNNKIKVGGSLRNGEKLVYSYKLGEHIITTIFQIKKGNVELIHNNTKIWDSQTNNISRISLNKNDISFHNKYDDVVKKWRFYYDKHPIYLTVKDGSVVVGPEEVHHPLWIIEYGVLRSYTY